MRMKIAAAIALVIVGVGAIGFAILSPGANGTDGVTYLTTQAAVADVTEEAVASGTIAAATTYALTFGSEPTLTQAGSSAAASTSATGSTASGGSGSSSVTWPVTAVNVSVGDVVKAGDVLAEADPLYADLQVTIARANLDAAEARLKTDTGGADALTRKIARSSVTQASNQLAQARQSYSDTLRQNALSLKQARAAVTATRQQLLKDQRAGAPTQTIEADKKAWDQARENLASTQVRVAASNHQAANQVTNASLQLTSARNSYAKQVAGADDAQIASDEAAVATATSSLASAQAAAEHATITAPADGRVTAVDVTAGSNAPSGTAITLQSTALAVTASFTEDDILSLQVGQAATITVSASGATLAGTVAKISPAASGTSGSSVVSYAVTILVDDVTTTPSSTGATPSATVPEGGATTVAATSPSPSPAASTSGAPLPGMSAEVTVTVATVNDVVAVPAAAINGTNGQYTIRVLSADGQLETRSVQVGLITSSMAEITSGVVAGDTVVTGTSADQAASGSSSSAGGSRQFGGGGMDIPGGGVFVNPGGGPGVGAPGGGG